MIQSIIRFSVKNKIIVMMSTVTLIIAGVFAMFQLPVDAVPDITNNQIQVVTTSPSLAPQEVEQFISFPLETSMSNIPGVEEIRSISRFGISVVTIIFDEDVPSRDARQLVKEQLDLASQQIQPELGQPQMMPITTGLGEIYQYVLRVAPGYDYSAMELRTMQDFIVKRQLAGVKGIIDVSSFGGYLKQYQVSVDPYKLQSRNLTLEDVFKALELNNQNSGGSYIEKDDNAFYIRTEGLIRDLSDIENLVVSEISGSPVFIRDIGTVGFGSPSRYGAMTMDGEGETVGGITLMLKGANSSKAIENVKKRVERIQKSLPEGVSIDPYLDRSVLVGKATSTVGRNLIEGGLIVIFVLVLLLGNWRAGIIVASVIPLSLLFAFILMNYFGVSANLMSLGAIDFGIVIDGAVIVVEGIIHFIYTKHIGKKLSQNEMDDLIVSTSSRIIGSAAFGVLIIIVVFLPIMTLTGIEGKMFVPMAQTVSFAILGALLLSITYVPMMSALILKKDIRKSTTFSDKIIKAIQSVYQPALSFLLKFPKTVVATAILIFTSALLLFNQMGAEFIPTLEEGDLAMQVTIEPGSSLTKMIETTTAAEKILKDQFPEVKHVVSKIGTAEIPTDPMAVEDADVMILLKEKKDWVSADNREDLVAKMKKSLTPVSHAQFDFTQPIELRFNELISGSKNDLAIQLYGDNLDSLAQKATEIAQVATNTKGAGDVRIEQTEGLPQLIINYNREKVALYNVNINELNTIIRAAFAGEKAGTIYEGQRHFDLTVRLGDSYRNDIDLGQLFVTTPKGEQIPISALADIKVAPGPMQISRNNASRSIVIGVNIRNRDIASYVAEIEKKISEQVQLPVGYFLEYGGQFKNLTAAKDRLMVAVPVALVLIFLLLYLAFRSFKYALIIYITVPMSIIGGILALYMRGMPFSISAGVGFIALFGVAVLNGIVLISYFNELKKEESLSLHTVVTKGSSLRLRPVLMTAAVASFGFLPMALATSAGAEVQKPLATVVIGGLVSATLLTLFVLPVIYSLSHRTLKIPKKIGVIVLLIGVSTSVNAQESATLDQILDSAYLNNVMLGGEQLQLKNQALERKRAYSLSTTEVDYQYGQINSGLRDYNFSAHQSIENPISMVRKAQLADAKAETITTKIALLKRDLRQQVASLWLECESAQSKLQLYQSHLIITENYLERLRKKVEAGEERPASLGMIQLKKRDLQQKLLLTEMYQKEKWLELKLLCGIKSDLSFPSEATLLQVPVQIPLDSVTLHADFTHYNTQQMLTIEKERQSIRSNYFPEVSLGYFNQSLDNITNFQGVQVRLSAPLFDRKQRMDAKFNELQSKHQVQVNEVNEAGWMRSLDHAYHHYLEVKAYYEKNEKAYREDITFLRSVAEADYRSGSIDYQVYMKSQEQILEAEIQLLNLKSAFVAAQIELLYYI